MNTHCKKVLVTGADGFIGSHLVEALITRGYDVRAFCIYNSFNSLGWLDTTDCLSQVETVSGDLRDAAFCRSVMKGVDKVLHLGALIAIPYSYSAPQSYIDTNISGTLNICQAAMDLGINRIVHTSTSEVYGTAQYVPIDEHHPLQPQSPYSASKIGADAIAMSFYNSFSLPVTIARPFNTFGPRQSARAVIPSIITQLANQADSLQLGDLRPTRDLNYVEDTCAGIIALLESENVIGETINLGSGQEISIGGLVKEIQEIMGTDVPVLTDSQRLRPKNSEVYRLLADNKKLTELTGFQQQVGFRQGLERTVEWFKNKENLRNYKSDVYNV